MFVSSHSLPIGPFEVYCSYNWRSFSMLCCIAHFTMSLNAAKLYRSSLPCVVIVGFNLLIFASTFFVAVLSHILFPCFVHILDQPLDTKHTLLYNRTYNLWLYWLSAWPAEQCSTPISYIIPMIPQWNKTFETPIWVFYVLKIYLAQSQVISDHCGIETAWATCNWRAGNQSGLTQNRVLEIAWIA